MQHGDTVRCLSGDIDRNRHDGETGKVQGFARLSPYHPREVSVRFPDGSTAWFWVSNVEIQIAEHGVSIE